MLAQLFQKIKSELETASLITHSLMELPIVQLLENFPAVYGTRRFITAVT
jgi:hypothetical protein